MSKHIFFIEDLNTYIQREHISSVEEHDSLYYVIMNSGKIYEVQDKDAFRKFYFYTPENYNDIMQEYFREYVRPITEIGNHPFNAPYSNTCKQCGMKFEDGKTYGYSCSDLMCPHKITFTY